MDKNLVYIGLALIVISFIILAGGLSQQSSLSSSLVNNVSITNFTVASNSFAYSSSVFTNQSLVFILVRLDKNSNVYLFNSTGFNAWTSYMRSNATGKDGYDYAVSLERKGALYIYKNASYMTVPQGYSSLAALPVYNQSAGYLNAGTYYVTVDNTNDSPSYLSQINATVVYLPPLTNSTIVAFASQHAQGIWFGFGFFIALILGIIFLVFGLIRNRESEAYLMPQPKRTGLLSKEKTTPEETKAYIDRLYRNVGRQAKKPAKKKGKSGKR